MTILWSHDVPPVGYLSSCVRRSDSDCVNRPHLDAVLRARRDRENYAHPYAGPTPGASLPRASDAASPDRVASILEWWDALPSYAQAVMAIAPLVGAALAALIVTL